MLQFIFMNGFEVEIDIDSYHSVRELKKLVDAESGINSSSIEFYGETTGEFFEELDTMIETTADTFYIIVNDTAVRTLNFDF